MPNHSPIGVFDSGLGGLSVLKQIRKLLPRENLLYVADNAHAPYGEKSTGFILQRVHILGDFFQQQNIKALVVACNTATSAAVHALRQGFDYPVIGIEPAIKPAARQTQSGVVGVLATRQTLAGEKFMRLCQQQPGHVQFILQACPGWVRQVEDAQLNSASTQKLVEEYVQPLLAAGADTLVLGCTHYPFLSDMIAAVAGDAVRIIDPSEAVARQLQRTLTQRGLLAAAESEGEEYFWQSGSLPYDHAALSQLYGRRITFKNLSGL